MPIAFERPLNLRTWIEDARKRSRSGAGDWPVFGDTADFSVSIASGPSQRKDYHISPFEELFLQVEGELVLRVRDDDGVVGDVIVREGELFTLPANVPHSPQRTAGSVGLVIERRRPKSDDDTLRFYCDRCSSSVFEESFSLEDAAEELSQILSRFWEDATMRTCRFCGTVVQPPGKSDTIVASPIALVPSPTKGANAGRSVPRRAATSATKPAARRATVRGR